jgi:hypothetical protein
MTLPRCSSQCSLYYGILVALSNLYCPAQPAKAAGNTAGGPEGAALLVITEPSGTLEKFSVFNYFG